MWRLGLDIGGTKIEALAMAPDGAEAGRRRIDTPRDYEAMLQAISALIDDMRREFKLQDLTAIGAGIPGSISPATGLVRNANSTWMNGRPFQRDLDAVLGLKVF
ncbi:MAG: ROK family protein, partial [Chitinophagales bacterium]|nr:ROK family protein [Hyphomicrobiales bacterium]